MQSEILKDLNGTISDCHEALRRDLSRVRTGRASVTILDGVRVDYYGTPTPLRQMASLAVRMGQEHSPGGFRILSNFGQEALQTQQHGHLHVVGGSRLGRYVTRASERP